MPKGTLVKKLITVLLVGIVVLSIGCSKKRSNPSGDDNPEPPYKFEKQQTIGNLGGILQIDGFSLIIPDGAFGSDNELKLYSSTEDVPFGDNEVSKVFRIEGFPATFYKPIRVAIQYTGTLQDSTFIALGEDVFVPSFNTVQTAYRTISVVDSSGFLVSQLPIPEDKGKYKCKADSTNINFVGVSGYSSYTSLAGLFKIDFPSAYVTESQQLAGYLDEAYNIFQNLGFSCSTRTNWPVSVTVKSFGGDTFGLASNSTWGDNYGYMEFNQNKMNDMPEMRRTAGHEFFHFVQNLYDSRNRYSKAKFASPHYWLNEAMAVWSEEKFPETPGYCSLARSGNVMAPFSGMQAGASESAQLHGYGMSAVIKYLVGIYGDTTVVKVYQNIYSGKTAVASIDVAMPHIIAWWWDDFLTAYAKGDVYSDVAPSFLGAQCDDKFIIQAIGDTLKTFSGSYPDLSGKIYSVWLKYANIDSNASIRVRAIGSSSNVSVFRYKSSTIVFMGESDSAVTVSGVRALTADGWNLIVLVSCDYYSSPYTGTTDISLEIKVEKKQYSIFEAMHRTDGISYLCYLDGNVGFYYLHKYLVSDTLVTDTSFENFCYSKWDSRWYPSYSGGTTTYPPLTWNGNNFTTTVVCTVSSFGSISSLTFSGSLSGDASTLVSLHYENSTNILDPTYHITAQEKVTYTVTNIPLNATTYVHPDGCGIEYEGGDHPTEITYSYSSVDSSGNFLESKDLVKMEYFPNPSPPLTCCFFFAQ